jgi:CHASE2 domain-containing sensor protein
MTLDGRFREPAAVPVVTRIGHVALIVAALATAGAVALLALWFALALIPVALGAGLVAYGVLRYQRWRGQGPFARSPGPFRG